MAKSVPLSPPNSALVLYHITTNRETRTLAIPPGKTWDEILEFAAPYIGTHERIGDTVSYT